MSNNLYYTKDECYKNLENEFRINYPNNWHNELKKFEKKFFDKLEKSTSKSTSKSKSKKIIYTKEAIIQRICESGKLVKLSKNLQKLTRSQRNRAVEELDNPLLKNLPDEIVEKINKEKQEYELQIEKENFVKDCFRNWENKDGWGFYLHELVDFEGIIRNIAVHDSDFEVDFLYLANFFDIDLSKFYDKCFAEIGEVEDVTKKERTINKKIQDYITNKCELINKIIINKLIVRNLILYTDLKSHMEELKKKINALSNFDLLFQYDYNYEHIKEKETSIYDNIQIDVNFLKTYINKSNILLKTLHKFKIYKNYRSIDKLNNDFDDINKQISNFIKNQDKMDGKTSEEQKNFLINLLKRLKRNKFTNRLLVLHRKKIKRNQSYSKKKTHNRRRTRSI